MSDKKPPTIDEALGAARVALDRAIANGALQDCPACRNVKAFALYPETGLAQMRLAPAVCTNCGHVLMFSIAEAELAKVAKGAK